MSIRVSFIKTQFLDVGTDRIYLSPIVLTYQKLAICFHRHLGRSQLALHC